MYLLVISKRGIFHVEICVIHYISFSAPVCSIYGKNRRMYYCYGLQIKQKFSECILYSREVGGITFIDFFHWNTVLCPYTQPWLTIINIRKGDSTTYTCTVMHWKQWCIELPIGVPQVCSNQIAIYPKPFFFLDTWESR